MLGSQVTPQSCPWPPTACTGCSCPSGPSGASANGPKWFPIAKNLGLKKNQVSSLLGSRVTPRRCPWPPTARIGCSWPSGQSGASENGPKWFPIPKNLGFKKNQVSSLLRSWVTPWRARPPPQTIVVDFPHHRVVFAGAHRVFWVGLCLNYPDHPKKPRKNRLCNPPP